MSPAARRCHLRYSQECWWCPEWSLVQRRWDQESRALPTDLAGLLLLTRSYWKRRTAPPQYGQGEQGMGAAATGNSTQLSMRARFDKSADHAEGADIVCGK